jgi:MFS family permease
LLACCIFVVGGAIQTAGVVIAMLYVGRLIAGIGVGFLTMIIPIYQAELAHRKIRGKITSLQQLFNALGQIFATWIGYGCFVTWDGTGDSREWRIPLAVQIIPALFLGALIFIFPESPRYVSEFLNFVCSAHVFTTLSGKKSLVVSSLKFCVGGFAITIEQTRASKLLQSYTPTATSMTPTF